MSAHFNCLHMAWLLASADIVLLIKPILSWSFFAYFAILFANFDFLFLLLSLSLSLRCAPGYMGQRCEFKDLDGSYLGKDIQFTYVPKQKSIKLR